MGFGHLPQLRACHFSSLGLEYVPRLVSTFFLVVFVVDERKAGSLAFQNRPGSLDRIFSTWLLTLTALAMGVNLALLLLDRGRWCET